MRILLAFGLGVSAVSAAYALRRGGLRRVSARCAAAFMADSEEYTPPSWIPRGVSVPRRRLQLANLPTPLHTWRGLPRVPDGTEVWIKRDDTSGCELSGNKVRKLEFLLAEAVEKGHDCVITVGGMRWLSQAALHSLPPRIACPRRPPSFRHPEQPLPRDRCGRTAAWARAAPHPPHGRHQRRPGPRGQLNDRSARRCETASGER